MATRTISATEARVHFGELLDSVSNDKDVVFIERSGVQRAVLVPIDVWFRMRDDDPWAEAGRKMEAHWKYMAEAKKAGRIRDKGISTEELVRQMREERSEHLLRNLLGQQRPD
jgi:prevent-host-death family protein